MSYHKESKENCSRRAFLGAVASGTGSVMLGGCRSNRTVEEKYQQEGALVGRLATDDKKDMDPEITIAPPPTYPAGTPVEETVKQDFDYFIYEIKRLLESGSTEKQVRDQWVKEYPHEVTLEDGTKRLLGILDATFDPIYQDREIVGFKVSGCMLRGGGISLPGNVAYDKVLWEEGIDCEIALNVSEGRRPTPPPYPSYGLVDGSGHHRHVVYSSSSSSSSW